MAIHPESTSAATTLEDRFILVLREAGEVYGMWARLEELTGIVSARWRKGYTSQQRPTPDMVQALCRQRPEYAFWIATGITDAANGHKAPASALPFPEWRGACPSDSVAKDYFRASLDLLDTLAARGGLQQVDQAERREAFGLRPMNRQWWASPLAGVAAELADESPAYGELKRVCKLRDDLRSRVKLTTAKKRSTPEESRLQRVDPLTRHLHDGDLFWS